MIEIDLTLNQLLASIFYDLSTIMTMVEIDLTLNSVSTS